MVNFRCHGMLLLVRNGVGGLRIRKRRNCAVAAALRMELSADNNLQLNWRDTTNDIPLYNFSASLTGKSGIQIAGLSFRYPRSAEVQK